MSEKQYDLGFGYMGNGTTVWNRLEEVDYDYKTIAHISGDGSTVKYYEDIPDDVKKRIGDYAECIKSHNTEESEDDEEFEV